MHFLMLLMTVLVGTAMAASVFSDESKPQESSRRKRSVGGAYTTIEELPYVVSFEQRFFLATEGAYRPDDIWIKQKMDQLYYWMKLRAREFLESIKNLLRLLPKAIISVESTNNTYWKPAIEPSCIGVILNRDYILTGAYCLISQGDWVENRVRAGSQFIGKNGSVHPVAEYFIHPNYTNMHNNLALMRLAEPIDINNVTTKAIPMFEYGEEIKDGELATVPDWGEMKLFYEDDLGFTQQLQTLQQRVVNRAECANIYKGIQEIPEELICAESPDKSNPQSVCPNDIVGPMVVNGKLAGIVTSVEACESFKYPAVFNEISRYRKWIDEHVK